MACANDSRRKRTILLGGAGDQGPRRDTWEWDGSLCTQVAENGPLGARTITYDAQPGYALVFAYPTNEASHGSTWAWDGMFGPSSTTKVPERDMG